MGLVYAEITLKNATDVAMARRGIIKEQEIRQTTVQAMVDTGASTLIISEAIRQELGVEVEMQDVVTLANNAKEVCKYTEPVAIHWENRHIHTSAMVLPGINEVLLGAIPLEGLDLVINPSLQALTGAHGDRMVLRA